MFVSNRKPSPPWRQTPKLRAEIRSGASDTTEQARARQDSLSSAGSLDRQQVDPGSEAGVSDEVAAKLAIPGA